MKQEEKTEDAIKNEGAAQNEGPFLPPSPATGGSTGGMARVNVYNNGAVGKSTISITY